MFQPLKIYSKKLMYIKRKFFQATKMELETIGKSIFEFKRKKFLRLNYLFQTNLRRVTYE